jgi:multidrug efflux pump subunit AcrB
VEAAVFAARARLRPILMTSFAFILGAVPLVMASGAGAELRQALGTAVFFGMTGVTGSACCSRPLSTWCAAAGRAWAVAAAPLPPAPQPAE